MGVVEKVVETKDTKTIIRYGKDTGLIIKQYVVERDEDGLVLWKSLFGIVELDGEEIHALKEVLNNIGGRDVRG